MDRFSFKKIIALLWLLVYTNNACAQKIDTVKYYKISGALDYSVKGNCITHILDTVCTLEGKPFPIRDYIRIENTNCRLWGNCNGQRDSSDLYFVKAYTLDETLLYCVYQLGPEEIFFGPYKDYYPNGQIRVDGQYMFYGEDRKQYEIRRHWNNKTGLWKYYNAEGKLIKKKRFKNGHRKLV